jgi:hypothetical protein
MFQAKTPCILHCAAGAAWEAAGCLVNKDLDKPDRYVPSKDTLHSCTVLQVLLGRLQIALD